jgi:hypothetical protein
MGGTGAYDEMHIQHHVVGVATEHQASAAHHGPSAHESWGR